MPDRNANDPALAFLKGVFQAFFLIVLPAVVVVRYYDQIDAWVHAAPSLPVLQSMTDDFRTGREIAGELFVRQVKTFYAGLDSPSARTGAVGPVRKITGGDWNAAAIEAGLRKKLRRRQQPGARAYFEYIDRYRTLAQAEMARSRIPASIILAQALLESNAGRGKLTRATNNHFGVKCRPKRGFRRDHTADFNFHRLAVGCYQCHDDVWWDRFEVYDAPEDSYSRHAALLREGRYRWMIPKYHVGNVYQIPREVYGRREVPYYAAWAVGLKDSGYATAPRYAETLIMIIETYQLWRLDYEVVVS
jgi:hypothetical protein